jgi:hypothetical protein
MTNDPRNDLIRPPISFEELQEALRLAHVERSRYFGALMHKAASAVATFVRRALRIGATSSRPGDLSGRPAV